MKKNIAQQGRSMIEMLGVLGIIGVLTVGGFSLVNKATTSHKINNVIDDLGALASKTRMIFREFILDGEDDFNKYICEARAYPETLEYDMTTGSDGEMSCSANKTFVNNDDVEFSVHKFSNNNMDYFTIVASGLDEEMCVAISQTGWGSPSTNGYMGMCVGCTGTGCSHSCENNSVLTANANASNVAKGGNKISLDGAANACNGTNNYVYLTFR